MKIKVSHLLIIAIVVVVVIWFASGYSAMTRSPGQARTIASTQDVTLGG